MVNEGRNDSKIPNVLPPKQHKKLKQHHKQGSVRHVEKRRVSTCLFADRIARASLEAYHMYVPQSFRDEQRQTVVAALIAFFHPRSDSDEQLQPNTKIMTMEDDGKASFFDDNGGYLQVMGLGVGTKFLQEEILENEYKHKKVREYDGKHIQHEKETQTNCLDHIGYGARVRDCHAEVLARRSFCRQLALEVLYHLKSSKTTDDSIGKYTTILPNNYIPILECMPHRNIDESIPSSTTNIHEPKYKIKANVTLHFYTSSTPCGNAALKKFAKMSKETFDATLSPNSWPDPQPHPPIPSHSIRLGQMSLLLKKNAKKYYEECNHAEHDKIVDKTTPDINATTPVKKNTLNSKYAGQSKNTLSSSEQSTYIINNDTFKQLDDKSKSLEDLENEHTTNIQQKTVCTKKKMKQFPQQKIWPCNQNDNWCPPGCTIVAQSKSEKKGSIHCCSDKICRWNVLGWQGSFLSTIVLSSSASASSSASNQVKIQSITIGRKMSSCICKRALCCRVGKCFGINGGSEQMKDNICDRVNHPAIMGTSVYMDENGTLDMTGDRTVGQDVRFNSSLCWAWWPNRQNKSNNFFSKEKHIVENVMDSINSNTNLSTSIFGENIAECINGNTGYALSYKQKTDKTSPDATPLSDSKEMPKLENILDASSLFHDEYISDISTISLLQLYNEILSSRSSYISFENPSSPSSNSKKQNVMNLEQRNENQTRKNIIPTNLLHPKTLSDIRLRKRMISPKYETAKDHFLNNHRIFKYWCRREYDS